jgi:hypothetical protein
VKGENVCAAPAVAKDAVCFSEVLTHDLFELSSARAGSEPAIFQAGDNGFDLFITVRLELIRGVPDGLVMLRENFQEMREERKAPIKPKTCTRTEPL